MDQHPGEHAAPVHHVHQPGRYGRWRRRYVVVHHQHPQGGRYDYGGFRRVGQFPPACVLHRGRQRRGAGGLQSNQHGRGHQPGVHPPEQDRHGGGGSSPGHRPGERGVLLQLVQPAEPLRRLCDQQHRLHLRRPGDVLLPGLRQPLLRVRKGVAVVQQGISVRRKHMAGSEHQRGQHEGHPPHRFRRQAAGDAGQRGGYRCTSGTTGGQGPPRGRCRFGQERPPKKRDQTPRGRRRSLLLRRLLFPGYRVLRSGQGRR